MDKVTDEVDALRDKARFKRTCVALAKAEFEKTVSHCRHAFAVLQEAEAAAERAEAALAKVSP